MKALPAQNYNIYEMNDLGFLIIGNCGCGGQSGGEMASFVVEAFIDGQFDFRTPELQFMMTGAHFGSYNYCGHVH